MTKKVPKIRFEGHEDEWKKYRIGELYAPLDERNNELISYSKTLSIATMTYRSEGSGAADKSLSNYKRLRLGDIAFEGHTSKEFRYGRFVLNDKGDGIMSPRFSAFRPLNDYPVYFWKYYIHYEPLMKNILVKSTKAGTMMHEIVSEDFLNNYLAIPTVEEQEKIGNYFQNLDNLIILHQLKHSKLLATKKAMLEKMFPKEGETVPEIRFEGYSKPWLKKTIGECFSERVENMPEGELLSVTINYGIKRFADLNRNDNSNDDKSKYKKVYIGDIAYNSMRMWQGASGYSEYEGIVSPAYTVLSPNEGIDSKAISYLFKRGDMIHTFQLHSQGITSDNWNLKYPALKEIEIYVAEDFSEQEKIGIYFQNLDKLITEEQAKIEKLKNIKSALLEKMFA